MVVPIAQITASAFHVATSGTSSSNCSATGFVSLLRDWRGFLVGATTSVTEGCAKVCSNALRPTKPDAPRISTFIVVALAFLRSRPAHTIRDGILNCARLNAVQYRVVPIRVEVLDLAVIIEPQYVGVRDVHDLTLFRDRARVRGNRPAHLCLNHNAVSVADDRLNYFDSKVRDRLRKRLPDDIDAASNRHDTLATIR